MSNLVGIHLRKLNWESLLKLAKLCGVATTFRKRGDDVHYKRPTVQQRLRLWALGDVKHRVYFKAHYFDALWHSDRLDSAEAYEASPTPDVDTTTTTPTPAMQPSDLTAAQIERIADSVAKEFGKQLDGGITDAFKTEVTAVAERTASKVAAGVAAQYRRIEVAPLNEDGPGKTTDFIMPPEFDLLLQYASQRINILMIGPTQCGKTFSALRLAEALDLPFGSVSCTQGVSEADLGGRLLPGKGGRFEYHPSPFVERFTKGGVFLFDELDRADPNVLTFMNSALANDVMHIPYKQDEGGMLKKHPDFVAVAAANTFGTGGDMQYTGANQLDAATLERFKIGRVWMDYNKDVERSLALPEVCAWGWAVRDAIRTNGLRRIMSTRTLKELSVMTRAYGWKVEDYERPYFADWSEDEIGKAREAGRTAYREAVAS